MVDLKEDKKGYDNPLVDAESGAIKHSQVAQSPTADQEKSNLQKNFGMPSATKEDIDANQPNHQRKDDFAPSISSSTSPSGAITSATKGKILGRFSKKQKAGGAGLLVGLISILIAFIMSGPLQALHFAQTLTGFHLNPRSNQTGIRISKMTRHIKSNTADTKAKARLSTTGKYFAPKAEAKLNRSGFKSAYDGSGHFIGYDISPEARSSLTPAELDKLGAKIDEHGRLVAKDGIRFRDSAMSRKLLNRAGGYSYISSALQARFLSKMGLMDFHPIQKIQDKSKTKIDEKLKKWKEERSGRLKGTIGTLLNGGQPISTKTNTFLKSTAGKAFTSALGLVSLTSIYCMASDLINTVYDSHLTEVVEPMMRTGMESIAVGSQIQSGHDIDLETLGELTKNMRSKENAEYGDAMNAESIRYQQDGVKDVGTPLPSDVSLTVSSGLIETMNKVVDGINAVFLDNSVAVASGLASKEAIVGAVCSTPGQVGGAAAGLAAAFFSGSASQAALTIAKAAFQAAVLAAGIGMAEDKLGYETLDPTAYFGGQYGAIADAGAFAGTNMIGVRSAGRQLETPELGLIKEDQKIQKKEENATRSIADKYLNPIKPDTFVSKIIDDNSANVSTNIASLPSTFFGAISSGFTNIASVFSPKLRAVTDGPAYPYDYGIPYVGFSQAEIEDPALDDPFTNAEKASEILTSDKGEHIKKILSECNNLDVQDDLSSTYTGETSIQYEGPKGIEKNPLCSENSPEILSVRMAVYDTQTGESLACYEGDEEACTTLGIGNTQTNADCPPGTSSDPTSSGIAGKIYWPLESGDKFASDGGHDFANGGVPIGTPVHAITDGTVIESKDIPGCDGRNCGDGMQSYGRLIKIDHGGKVGTINYAHFSKRMVEKGDKVVAGQIIGLSGNAGNSSGPHLHIDSNPAETAIALLKSLNAEKPPKSVGAATPSSSTSCTTGTPGVYKDPIRDVKSFTKSRVDPGVDFASLPSGSVIHPLGNATIIEAGPSGGWSGYFTRYKLEDGPAKGLNVYMAHKCKPKVKKGDKVTADTVLCTIEGGDYIETGWAAEDAGTTMSEASREASCNTYGHEDPYGTNFYEFLKSQGFKNAVQTAPKTSNYDSCKVPAKYPTWK